VAFAPDGSQIATADDRGKMTVIDPSSGDIIHQDNTAATGSGWDLEYSPDGSLLALCTGDGDVAIWQTSDWEVTLSGDKLFAGGCHDGIFTAGSDVYVAVGQDGALQAWDMADGTLLTVLSFPRAVWSVSLSGTGDFLTIALDNGTAHVLSVP
jgi:WD40 repeat protein